MHISASPGSVLMPEEVIQIKRYPNRRYYARSESKYVSLGEIEDMVRAGRKVEIQDSQTGEDMTRAVLTQIIVERQPEKMALFPIDMLHLILRSNEVTADFLRDYFRHSLTYLNYLQQHSPSPSAMARPMHWVKAWLDAIAPKPEQEDESPDSGDTVDLAQRLEELEARLQELEKKEE